MLRPGNSLSMPSTSNGSHFFFGADLPSTVDAVRWHSEAQVWFFLPHSHTKMQADAQSQSRHGAAG